ncbi:hypothetical protein PPL_04484 [Heterostelium album PN500]|uniref:N-acetyltransferase domain-containing protein n=1 Tax=Heterostelium pallidum (strain ATCC 26659 / Pp 5 / PN500) TaxID=670386 RepID=D3B7P6_HETP5|nr:hypothetical protein PPL_04484 [Heterostelium album PN500]EFA82789.1 hypothetical protein PPL_04484 [Heterostelium album PN500]|eukprot:XP_020434906.1 hypothetical protein PPL_04484 [Heterostelium album PN500]
MKNFEKTQTNELGQIVGAAVTDNTPVIYKQADLTGENVRLISVSNEILTEELVTKLYQTVQSEPNTGCWTYLPYTPPTSQEDLNNRLNNRFGFTFSEPSYLYIIENKGEYLGWLALINQRSKERSIEVGNVYFSHKLRQTKTATETLYLILKSCFDQKFRRVEWKCDGLNLASRRAAERFGFVFEGEFRQDRMTKGRNRNTQWLSILDEEWTNAEKAYISWLRVDNFDENGNQKQKLSDLMYSSRDD